jgi:hypothetical protein
MANSNKPLGVAILGDQIKFICMRICKFAVKVYVIISNFNKTCI